MIHFWADTHFNHKGIIGYCLRPYESVEEMNEALIAKWNKKVKTGDTVYLLGDFGFTPRKDENLPALLEHFVRLNGFKYLIVGNHDEKNGEVLALPWEGQYHLRQVKWNHRRIVVCHYALETWAGAHHGVFHAHGHSHGTLKRVIPHRWDVGVDVEKEGPVSFDELIARGEGENFEPADHHGDL